jgi:hypothetical protein
MTRLLILIICREHLLDWREEFLAVGGISYTVPQEAGRCFLSMSGNCSFCPAVERFI